MTGSSNPRRGSRWLAGLLTGVGHACLLESPKPFAQRVLRFLARHAQPRGAAA